MLGSIALFVVVVVVVVVVALAFTEWAATHPHWDGPE